MTFLLLSLLKSVLHVLLKGWREFGQKLLLGLFLKCLLVFRGLNT